MSEPFLPAPNFHVRTFRRSSGSNLLPYSPGSLLPSTSFAPPLSGHPEADLPTMSTPWILYRLYKLKTSSADFMRHLHFLIQLDEREQYLTSIQGPELTRLVEFLGEVPILPSAPCLVIKQALQTLNVLSTHDDVSRQCLHKLQAVCAHRETLPSSYIVSGNIARDGGHPITYGGIADVWEGTYRHRRAYIKLLKAHLNGNQALKKVCIRCGTSLSRLLKNTHGPCSYFAKRPSCGKG